MKPQEIISDLIKSGQSILDGSCKFYNLPHNIKASFETFYEVSNHVVENIENTPLVVGYCYFTSYFFFKTQIKCEISEIDKKIEPIIQILKHLTDISSIRLLIEGIYQLYIQTGSISSQIYETILATDFQNQFSPAYLLCSLMDFINPMFYSDHKAEISMLIDQIFEDADQYQKYNFIQIICLSKPDINWLSSQTNFLNYFKTNICEVCQDDDFNITNYNNMLKSVNSIRAIYPSLYVLDIPQVDILISELDSYENTEIVYKTILKLLHFLPVMQEYQIQTFILKLLGFIENYSETEYTRKITYHIHQFSMSNVEETCIFPIVEAIQKLSNVNRKLEACLVLLSSFIPFFERENDLLDYLQNKFLYLISKGRYCSLTMIIFTLNVADSATTMIHTCLSNIIPSLLELIAMDEYSHDALKAIKHLIRNDILNKSLVLDLLHIFPLIPQPTLRKYFSMLCDVCEYCEQPLLVELHEFLSQIILNESESLSNRGLSLFTYTELLLRDIEFQYPLLDASFEVIPQLLESSDKNDINIGLDAIDFIWIVYSNYENLDLEEAKENISPILERIQMIITEDDDFIQKYLQSFLRIRSALFNDEDLVPQDFTPNPSIFDHILQTESNVLVSYCGFAISKFSTSLNLEDLLRYFAIASDFSLIACDPGVFNSAVYIASAIIQKCQENEIPVQILEYVEKILLGHVNSPTGFHFADCVFSNFNIFSLIREISMKGNDFFVLKVIELMAYLDNSVLQNARDSVIDFLSSGRNSSDFLVEKFGYFLNILKNHYHEEDVISAILPILQTIYDIIDNIPELSKDYQNTVLMIFNDMNNDTSNDFFEDYSIFIADAIISFQVRAFHDKQPLDNLIVHKAWDVLLKVFDCDSNNEVRVDIERTLTNAVNILSSSEQNDSSALLFASLCLIHKLQIESETFSATIEVLTEISEAKPQFFKNNLLVLRSQNPEHERKLMQILGIA